MLTSLDSTTPAWPEATPIDDTSEALCHSCVSPDALQEQQRQKPQVEQGSHGYEEAEPQVTPGSDLQRVQSGKPGEHGDGAGERGEQYGGLGAEKEGRRPQGGGGPAVEWEGGVQQQHHRDDVDAGDES